MNDLSVTRYRRCTKCGCTKPETNEFFSRQRLGKNGLMARCKVCHNLTYAAWAAINKARKREYDKERRRKNPDQLAASYRAWFLANKDRRYAYRKRYIQEHEAFRLRIRQMNVERERNIKYTQEAMDYIPILRSDPCSYCGGEAETVDHIDAVASGGTSDWDNLTGACRSCNATKGVRSLLHFLLLR